MKRRAKKSAVRGLYILGLGHKLIHTLLSLPLLHKRSLKHAICTYPKSRYMHTPQLDPVVNVIKLSF